MVQQPAVSPGPLGHGDDDPLGTRGAFAPIPLDELQAAASLQTRFDRKYVLNARGMPALLGRIDPRARVLQIDGRRGFLYESLYFDTPARDSYLLAARRRRHRFKIRTRRYLESGLCFLEVKTRGGRGETVKHRLPISMDGMHGLGPAQLRFIDQALREQQLPPASELALEPALLTVYRRTTLLLGDGGTRVTIDTSPEWLSADGRAVRPPQMCILETKSPGGASELDRLLWRFGQRPQRISKYATGMALFGPELPANRWHRSMSTAFPGWRAAGQAQRTDLRRAGERR